MPDLIELYPPVWYLGHAAALVLRSNRPEIAHQLSKTIDYYFTELEKFVFHLFSRRRGRRVHTPSLTGVLRGFDGSSTAWAHWQLRVRVRL